MPFVIVALRVAATTTATLRTHVARHRAGLGNGLFPTESLAIGLDPVAGSFRFVLVPEGSLVLANSIFLADATACGARRKDGIVLAESLALVRLEIAAISVGVVV